MLHNTCMFCSIKCIFISKNVILHWCETCSDFVEAHRFTEKIIIIADENTSVMHGTLDTLLLNATAVSDFKKSFTEKANHAII